MSGRTRGAIRGLVRFAFMGIILIVQFLILFILLYKDNFVFQQVSSVAFIAMQLFGLITVLFLIRSSQNATYKIVWTLIIMFFPILGPILYICSGRKTVANSDKRMFFELTEKEIPYLPQNDAVLEEFSKKHKEYLPMVRQLNQCGFPIYKGANAVEYYPNGEAFFPAFCDAMRKAEHYIFIEFFIIKNGKLWDEVKEVLIERANAGVEIRILYDDMGSLMSQDKYFTYDLEQHGIRVEIFNRVNRPANYLPMGMYVNYRNHQKIIVIDGEVGFTGGMNIGDEYINYEQRFGYWKDTFMKIEGPPVDTLLATFLKMWNMTCNKLDENYSPWFCSQPLQLEHEKGYYIPFADGPANNPSNPAEDLYKKMLNSAVDYCYITSPYLALDEEMLSTLIRVAHGGVDVRLLIPKHHDHWYTRLGTYSFFDRLVKNGVKIYEYTPGMVHAKMCVCDDQIALLGTINMDFRSFYLHYEDGIWMCDSPLIKDIKDDILAAIDQSELVDLEQWRKRPLRQKTAELFISVIVPML